MYYTLFAKRDEFLPLIPSCFRVVQNAVCISIIAKFVELYFKNINYGIIKNELLRFSEGANRETLFTA
jgi:hypothetical protein